MGKMTPNKTGLASLVAFFTLFPFIASAQVANFVFTSDPQTIEVGTTSKQLTVQAQAAGGASVNIPSTACLSLTSTSAQGQFSSSATNWSSVTALTMNKNTANKNFFYQDTQVGTQTLTVKVALRPESVSSACASWPLDQWNIEWTAIQSISIVNAGSGGQGSEDSGGTSTTTQQTTTTSAPQQTSAPVSSYVAPPEPQIFADAGSDRIVIVAADTIFAGRAYDRKKESVSDHIRFSWNFGDGSTAEGASVLHHFDYPGRYAVVLNITENIDTASDRVVITAEPAKLSFTSISDGSVAIQNLAGRDLDLSNWIIRSLGRQFILPKDSIILSNETLRIGEGTLGFRSGIGTELDYPNGALALRAGENSQTTAMPVEQPAQPSSSPAPETDASLEQKSASAPENDVNSDETPAKAAIEKSISIADEKDNEIPDESISSNSQVAAAASASPELAAAGEGAGLPAQAGGSSLWWLGAFGIALAGSGAVYAARRARRRELFDSTLSPASAGKSTPDESFDSAHDKSFDASEWKIIDDSSK